MLNKKDVQALKNKKVLTEEGEFYVLKDFKVLIGDVEKHLENVPVLTADHVKDWIDKWRQLFPKGTNSIDRAYRGDKQACVTKMKKFVTTHRYPVDIIMKATQKAIDIASKKNYEYFPQAHYFIIKDGQSMLAQYCEQFEDIDEPVQRYRRL